MAQEADIEDLKEQIRAYMDYFSNKSKNYEHDTDWVTPITPHLSLHSARMPQPSQGASTPSAEAFTGPEFPTATFAFTVQQEHSNRLGNLHGGCTATLFDFCTSIALVLILRPGHWQTFGVTRTLNCSYLRPIPIGTKVLIECEVVNAGKQMALLRGVIRRCSDGAIMATCEHGKFSTDPPLEKL